jgi:hypothetical protein
LYWDVFLDEILERQKNKMLDKKLLKTFSLFLGLFLVIFGISYYLKFEKKFELPEIFVESPERDGLISNEIDTPCRVGYVLSEIPTPSPSASPTPVVTPTPTPIQIVGCNNTCASAGYQCSEGLICYVTNELVVGSDKCRNPECVLSTSCICPTPTPTPTPSPSASPTPIITPTPTPSSTSTASCSQKLAYKDVDENSAGNYNTDDINRLEENSEIVPGITFVYHIKGNPITSDPTGDIVWKDTLDSDLEFIDGESCVSYNSSSREITCNKGTDTVYNFAFRVKVKNDSLNQTITNKATVTTNGESESSCELDLLVREGEEPEIPELPRAGTFPPTLIFSLGGIVLVVLGLLF